MTLENKILTRINNLATEIVGKINSKIASHNSSETAHGSLFVKTVDKSNHSHGLISKDGKVTSTTTNVSKVVVTESDGTLKTIQKVPSENVVHQDLSSKLNKDQGTANSGKFMKVQNTGEVAPESVTIPEVNVRQEKTNGVEIGSINGIKLYCNENTTYDDATTALSGLMSKEDKAKLDGIKEGADSVTFSRTLNSGTEIGKLKINNDETILYCSNATHGNLTNDGKIGSNPNLPIITGTNGILQTGSFGTDLYTFCQGNDPRLSDTRTPTDNTVSTAKIQDSAVTSAKIANGTIVNEDIANATITGGKLVSGTITGTQLANSSVTSAKIANGTIIDEDVSTNANINADKIHHSISSHGTLANLKGLESLPTETRIGQGVVNKAIDNTIASLTTWSTVQTFSLAGVTVTVDYNATLKLVEVKFTGTAAKMSSPVRILGTRINEGYRPKQTVSAFFHCVDDYNDDFHLAILNTGEIRLYYTSSNPPSVDAQVTYRV